MCAYLSHHWRPLCLWVGMSGRERGGERERESKPQTPLHHCVYTPMAAGPNKTCLSIPRSICLATILGKSGGRRGCTVTGPLATNLNHKNAAMQGLIVAACWEELKMASDV